MFSRCCEKSKCRSSGYCSCNTKSSDMGNNGEDFTTTHPNASVYDESYSQMNEKESNATFVDNPPNNARILKPLVQERIVEVLKPEIEEKIVEVPQVQYVEKIVEVPQVILQEKLIHIPKPVIHERIKKCPKPIYQEKIVEVPQVKIVDKIVEVPQYIYQEKIIEVPKIMVQERIIPVPKKVIKEKIVQVPQVVLKNVNVEKTIEEPEYIPEYVKKDIPYTQVVDRPYHVEKVVEVPHVQHIYRNIVSPQYRHIPKPVEVPMAHYRTFPVEKLVDRNVPVPVEIQIVQEFLCPKIEARYKEIPVPVHVQRIIEHPIPKDAMNNPHLLPLYYQEDTITNPSNANKNQNNQNKQPSKGCFMFNCNKNDRNSISQENITNGNNPVELLLHTDKGKMNLPFTHTNPMMNNLSDGLNHTITTTTNNNNNNNNNDMGLINSNSGHFNRHSFAENINRGPIPSQMSMNFTPTNNMMNTMTQLNRMPSYQQQQTSTSTQKKMYANAMQNAIQNSMQNGMYASENGNRSFNNTNGYVQNELNGTYNSIPRSFHGEEQN